MSEWKDIEGYEGKYQVNILGEVKALAKTARNKNGTRNVPEMRMKIFLKNGYPGLILAKDGIKRNLSIHRLIAAAFIPRIPGKEIINHKNGIKTDNRIENLEWCTIGENTKHAYRELGVKSAVKQYDDIDFLTYATCLRKFNAKDLKNQMHFATFRKGVKGVQSLGVSETLSKYFKEWPLRRGSKAKALAALKGEG